jgi:hypothetical protein
MMIWGCDTAKYISSLFKNFRHSLDTRGNWENSKLCENTPPFGRRVSTQFLVFPIPTRVDIRFSVTMWSRVTGHSNIASFAIAYIEHQMALGARILVLREI